MYFQEPRSHSYIREPKTSMPKKRITKRRFKAGVDLGGSEEGGVRKGRGTLRFLGGGDVDGHLPSPRAPPYTPFHNPTERHERSVVLAELDHLEDP